MTTASPVRIVETKGSRNWPSTKEATSSSNNMAAHELGLLLKEHRFLGNMKDVGPNRSGSAPPSMEGSFAAIGNLIGLQNCSLEGGLACISNAIKTCESEEQLRADPAYLEYYLSNVNLNPRLPPPLISRENRHLAHHVGRFGDARRKISFDDTNNSSSFLSRATLSTHKEEPEDDRSSTQASSTLAGRSTSYLSDQFTSSLEGRHKSLVDLIQEDFPRTPSPVYNNQSRSSNHGLTEEATDSDALVDPLHDSIGTAKLAELTTVTMGIHVHSVGSVPNNDISANPLSSSLSSNRTETPNSGPKVESSSDGAHLDIENGALVSGMAGSHLTSIELEMKNLSISSEQINQHALKHPQQNTLHRGGTASQVQGSLSQTMSLGERHSHNSAEHLNHGQSKVPFVEMQPVLQSTGLTPPLYATATAYMTSGNQFYPNLQPSSLFAPQYGVGGYTLNTTLMPPYIAGYPSHGTTIPMAFDNTTSPNYNASTTGVTTGGSITPGVDMQNLYKFYGQLGIPTQPSFTDPFYMHYFQHPSLDPYGSVGQYNSITSRGSIIGSQPDGYDLQKGPAAYIPDQRPRYLRSGETSIPSPRKGGNTASPNYYGSPPSLGLLMQYPTSPVGSTVLPGSTITGTSLPGRRNDNIRSSANSSRNVGAYSGWQGQRGREKVDNLRPCSFLEELKSSKARRFELSDIAGRIVEFSADQHGSRFIQQKLENCTCEEKASVFKEVLPHASALMTDVFGNYVIQKFFEHGNTEQRKELASQLVGHILPLSLQMYGCRVIQKALEVIELDQKTQLVLELDGHILRCVRDQNGNHVIQKCIECVPAERIGFIISAFSGQVATLSTHPYGCRVIQRVLEYCTDEMQSQSIVDEILQSACVLTQDQYGNYVTQHVLERGKPHERSQIISKLAGQIVQMSQHKFASNVIEKCLEHGDAAEREILIGEIVGQTEGNDNLLIMMKDQFANYVVQKILETCSDVQREILLSRIRVHLQALKKYTYGKHIVACIEELSGEETHASES